MSFTDCEEMNQDFFTLVYCIQNKLNSNCAGFDIKKRAFQNDLYSNIGKFWKSLDYVLYVTEPTSHSHF